MSPQKIKLKNGRQATIRQARVKDAAAVLVFVKKVAAETDCLASGKGDIHWTVEKERQFIREHARADNKLLIVAEVAGRLVGILGFTGDHRRRLRHAGELGMVVARTYWGRGLGTALIRVMIEWATASTVVRKIGLRVRVDNERALGLYRQFGFLKEGLVRRQFAVASTFHDAYLMGLEIDP